MRISVGALAAVLLAGCTTQVPLNQAAPVPSSRAFSYQSETSEPFGTLIVARDTGLVMGGGCYLAVYIDGKVTARIDTGEVVRFHVPIGDHLVGMGIDKAGSGSCSVGSLLKEQSVSLKVGQTKLYRIGGDWEVGLDIRPSSF